MIWFVRACCRVGVRRRFAMQCAPKLCPSRAYTNTPGENDTEVVQLKSEGFDAFALSLDDNPVDAEFSDDSNTREIKHAREMIEKAWETLQDEAASIRSELGVSENAIKLNSSRLKLEKEHIDGIEEQINTLEEKRKEFLREQKEALRRQEINVKEVHLQEFDSREHKQLRYQVAAKAAELLWSIHKMEGREIRPILKRLRHDKTENPRLWLQAMKDVPECAYEWLLENPMYAKKFKTTESLDLNAWTNKMKYFDALEERQIDFKQMVRELQKQNEHNVETERLECAYILEDIDVLLEKIKRDIHDLDRGKDKPMERTGTIEIDLERHELDLGLNARRNNAMDEKIKKLDRIRELGDEDFLNVAEQQFQQVGFSRRKLFSDSERRVQFTSDLL